MPNPFDSIINFIASKVTNSHTKPQGPYALAQTRITQTPHIIARGGFGQNNIAGVFQSNSNPNKAARSYREDIPGDLYPQDAGYILTPDYQDPDYNREVITHESMHALLDRLGVGTLFNKRKDISERVNPNISPSIKAHIKKTQPFGFSPQGVTTHEGLAYGIEDPTANHDAMIALADVLFENKDLKNLETFGKLISHSIAGTKIKARKKLESSSNNK